MGIRNFNLQRSKVRKTEKFSVPNIDLHTPPSPTLTQKSLFVTHQFSSQKKVIILR